MDDRVEHAADSVHGEPIGKQPKVNTGSIEPGNGTGSERYTDRASRNLEEESLKKNHRENSSALHTYRHQYSKFFDTVKHRH